MKQFALTSMSQKSCRNLSLVRKLSLLLLTLVIVACGADDEKALDTSVAPDTPVSPDAPLMRMLHFVPDTPEYREYLTFGDADAWHGSWNVPRVASFEQLEIFPQESRAYWLVVLPNQTTPPRSLHYEYLLTDDMRGSYGFDLFNLDRYMGAGTPPDWITILEFSFDGTQITDALTGSGYETQALETGGTLFSIRGDHEMDIKSATASGRFGDYNRIALLDGQAVVAKATANVTNAIQAKDGERNSLAENPDYIAVATALEDPSLEEKGELVGAILMESGSDFADPEWFLGSAVPQESREEFLRENTQGPELPLHNLVAFATRHTEGASSLILAVVFPKGTDAEAAADVLDERLRDYYSFMYRRDFTDRWTFDMATGVEAGGLPVALAVMRVDDPPRTSDDEGRANTAVFSWNILVERRDIGFLMVGSSAE